MLIDHQSSFISLKTKKYWRNLDRIIFSKILHPLDTSNYLKVITDQIVIDNGIVGFRGGNSSQLPEKWRNHMTAAEIKEKIGEEECNNYFKFFATRNSFDKIASWR